MDTKTTLEHACLRLEAKYHVPEDFKRRIRQILQPLFRHDLNADEMLVIERALERTYNRHSEPEPDTPSGVAELLLAESADSAHGPEESDPASSGAQAGAPTGAGPTDAAAAGAARAEAQDPTPAALPEDPARPRAVTTGVPSAGGGKGGVLLVKIDPKTKTAQLIRLSADDVKVLSNKAAISDFLKESDEEDTIVH